MEIAIKFFGMIIGGVILLLLLLGLFAIVPAGNVGIQDTFGNVSDNMLPPGFHIKSPLTGVIPMSIKTQRYSVEATAASRDLQDVATQVTLNFHINGEKAKDIYKGIGLTYQDIVIVPAVQESVKASTAKFTASELITERPKVRDAIEVALSDRLKTYNISIESVSITDFKFSPEFTQAIELKVTAEQDALKAKNVLERIKIEKEQTITQAEAQAQSVRLRADADAYSLKVIREELQKSDNLIQYRSIEKWDGVLPGIMTGVLPFVNVGGQ